MAKFLMTIMIAALTSATSHSQPRLELVAPDFDFGFTPQNTTLVHRVWFKSVGTDTVVITDIKTGCSCAVMPLEQDSLAPGDSIRVGIYWDIKRSMGAIGRTARVFTNAGQDPFLLHLQAFVLTALDSAQPVSIRPYKCELAKSSQAMIDSMSFTLTNHSDEDLSVTLVSAPIDECRLVLPNSVKAFSGGVGSVKVKPEYADTEFETSMTLLLSDKKATRLTIPIRRKFYMPAEYNNNEKQHVESIGGL